MLGEVPLFVKHDFISIPGLVEKIWTKANHKKAVQSKAEKAHQNDSRNYPRLPPFASSIYIQLNEVPDQFRKWCHRDPEAKKQLEEFLQSEEWNVIQMLPQVNKLKSNKKQIRDSIDKLRSAFDQMDDLEEFDAMTEQKYKKLKHEIDLLIDE